MSSNVTLSFSSPVLLQPGVPPVRSVHHPRLQQRQPLPRHLHRGRGGAGEPGLPAPPVPLLQPPQLPSLSAHQAELALWREVSPGVGDPGPAPPWLRPLQAAPASGEICVPPGHQVRPPAGQVGEDGQTRPLEQHAQRLIWVSSEMQILDKFCILI